MKTALILIAVLVGLAIFFLPLFSLVRIFTNKEYGWWSQLGKIRSKESIECAKRRWASIDGYGSNPFPKEKIRYFWFWKSCRIGGSRYYRFTVLISLFWIWGYPVYVIKHLITWLWKTI